MDGSGYIEQEELVAYLSDKLTPYEVNLCLCKNLSLRADCDTAPLMSSFLLVALI